MTEFLKAKWKRISGSARTGLLLGVLLIIGAAGALWVYAEDSDRDGMSDAFERFFGLDPADESDANLDSDADELLNIEEGSIWTDPFAVDTDHDGWPEVG